MSVSKDVVLKNLGEKNTVILSVQSEGDFQKSHIKGSYNRPLTHNYSAFVQDVERKFGKTRVFITYCMDHLDASAFNAGKILRDHGFKADEYLGGMKEWGEARLPTEGTFTKGQIPA